MVLTPKDTSRELSTQSGQTNRAHPVLTPFKWLEHCTRNYPWSFGYNVPKPPAPTPLGSGRMYPQLPREFRVQCTCNYLGVARVNCTGWPPVKTGWARFVCPDCVDLLWLVNMPVAGDKILVGWLYSNLKNDTVAAICDQSWLRSSF